MLLDLAHCHVGVDHVAVEVGHRLAVKGMSTRGRRAERVTVPSSSTSVTSTITALHRRSCRCCPCALTVISYIVVAR